MEHPRDTTPELERALANLIPQLSPGRQPPSISDIERILSDDRAHLLVARGSGSICGLVVLVLYDVPTGRRARIEDLVVDADSRGRGVGEALLRQAMQIAVEAKAHVLDLTSNPARSEANRLYRRLGFVRWETNVYRMVLDTPS